MNKVMLLLIVFVVYACMSQNKPDVPEALVEEIVTDIPANPATDSFAIHLAESTINWKATEMRGLKQRTGKISFKSGYILLRDTVLTGGKFIVDMESMDVTDVPAHEKIARRNLIAHLKNDDFFNTALYPISSLEITHAEKQADNSYTVQGNLTIRDITRNIRFSATREENKYFARFTFNRFLWNIAYEGSILNKTLIDEAITLDIIIKVQNKTS